VTDVPTDLTEGVVSRFDAAEGLGEITCDDGRVVGFHATQLADGSRRVETGARVVATLVAWHRGRIEATRIVLAGTGGRPAC
jgi:cold shock CspA family protein